MAILSHLHQLFDVRIDLLEDVSEPQRLAPSAFLLVRGTRHTADISG